MKHHRIAALAAAAALTAGAAQAQNVTIAGRLDLGVQRVDNGVTTDNRVDSGSYTASRLTVRGTEDLGGGLSALFFMESGIGADVGTASGGNRFWNRGAYVGLSSTQFGTLTIGRQYVPIFWPFLFSDDTGPLRLHGYSTVQSIQRSNFFRVNASALGIAAGNGTLASGANGIYSAGITSAFENNLVLYKTPSLGGLTLTGAVGAGERNADGGKVYGANAEFRSGGLYLGAGWNQKRGVVAATGEEQKINEQVLGGMYAVTSSVNLWGNAHGWKFENGAADLTGHDFMVGASLRLPTGQLWVNYARKSVGDCTNCDSSGFGIGYHHLLSKRTELYVSYANVSNDTNAANQLNGNAPGAAGKSVRGLAAGIAHVF